MNGGAGRGGGGEGLCVLGAQCLSEVGIRPPDLAIGAASDPTVCSLRLPACVHRTAADSRPRPRLIAPALALSPFPGCGLMLRSSKLDPISFRICIWSQAT
jgi:hypothetical protein